MTEKKDNTVTYIKLIVPILMALIGSQGWQYYATPDKIKEVAKTEFDNILIKKLQLKIDSIGKELISKEYAKNSLTNAVGRIKQFDGGAADSYLKDVFKIADDAIQNNEKWKNEQLPFIVNQINKRYLCPVLNVETNEITFQ